MLQKDTEHKLTTEKKSKNKRMVNEKRTARLVNITEKEKCNILGRLMQGNEVQTITLMSEIKKKKKRQRLKWLRTIKDITG